MKRSLIVASVLTLAAAPAFASDDMMAGYYGNTVKIGRAHV
jgi:hypothetical protein